MAEEAKTEGAEKERYDDVVRQLEGVVQRLEGGKLTLEDSLKEFEEGIRLVRRGEGLLNEAERKVEQLLLDNGEERREPLGGPSVAALPPVAAVPARLRPGGSKVRKEEAEDDVPF